LVEGGKEKTCFCFLDQSARMIGLGSFPRFGYRDFG